MEYFTLQDYESIAYCNIALHSNDKVESRVIGWRKVTGPPEVDSRTTLEEGRSAFLFLHWILKGQIYGTDAAYRCG